MRGGGGVRVRRVLGACFNCSSFHPGRRTVVRRMVRKRSYLILVPANNNGDLYCRIPTLTVRKATMIVSPLVSLVRSRIRTLGTGNVPTRTLGDNGSTASRLVVHHHYRTNSLGLLCMSPRGLVDRVPFLFDGVGVSLFTMSRTRYVDR